MSQQPSNLPQAADVVIVGAGIAGIATAWFLQQAGMKVVVCEKGVVAGEQSSRNWGWCRQQGRDRDELPIVIESLRRWQEIADQLDCDIGFRRTGSLYLCENDAEMARHDRFMSFAPNYDLETRRLHRNQLEDLFPGCPPRWRSGLFTPDDARAEPGLAHAGGEDQDRLAVLGALDDLAAGRYNQIVVVHEVLDLTGVGLDLAHKNL